MLYLHCHSCQSDHVVKNGHNENGKQNNLCPECGRNFVENPSWVPVAPEKLVEIDRALNERLPLRGICRVFDVALSWLMKHIEKVFFTQPFELGAWTPNETLAPEGYSIALEVDELWSFVGCKENQQWLWLAIERESRQVIAFQLGGRTKQDAQCLWEQIPIVYKEHCKFYTDYCTSYADVIPNKQHRPHGKDVGFTNHIERLSLTIRTRCLRLRGIPS